MDGIVWLGVRMADALSAVHQCGFVHHDLKPSNVLLGLDGQPRVLDFNLASDVRNAKSRLGGTLPYMPPEHLNAVRHPDAPGQMDARGDVYSLGVILYELLDRGPPLRPVPQGQVGQGGGRRDAGPAEARRPPGPRAEPGRPAPAGPAG